MKISLLFFGLQFILFSVYAQSSKISTQTELAKLVDISSLPAYSETVLKQISSYDRTGGNDDGFSGQYSFIRRNQDSSLVLLDVKGHGVINRIWTPTPTQDTLDFYFGASDRPNFSVAFDDLFSGKVYPFVAPLSGNEIGGFYTYVPIPFANGCKIVSRGKHLQFYQIQYSSYPDHVQVEDFQLALNRDAADKLKKIQERWNDISSDIEGETSLISVDTVLEVNKTITLADLKKGGRISAFKLGPSSVFAGLNKQIDLIITWDDESDPAIDMPVADFFGYAFGNISMQSLLLGSADNINYCYFPMPFDRQAKIALRYRSPNESALAEPLRIKAEIYFSNRERIPQEEGKFYTHWHANQQAPIGKPHTFLAGKGKGHYVGTLLQAQGLHPGMTLFFEGDDVTQIDGELRVHGTGSEDYFNGGWYALLDRWDRKMSLPLHGSLDYSLPYARTGGYRLFLSDKMPFKKEITHTIEHGPEGNNKPVDYTSVALYYADRRIAEQAQKPDNQLTKIYIPDTMMVYPQLMRFSLNGAVKIDGHVWQAVHGGQIKIDLSELPKGRYRLLADMEKNREGANVTLWQRQKQVSRTISFYDDDNTKVSNNYLCTIDLDDFKDAVTIHLQKDDNRNKIMLERLVLIRE